MNKFKKNTLWLAVAFAATTLASAQQVGDVTSVAKAGGGNPGIDSGKTRGGGIGGGIPISRNSHITTGSGIDVNGNIAVWGFRNSGQQGNGKRAYKSNAPVAKVNSLSDMKALTGGAYHLISLSDTGYVYGWGQSGYGETGCPWTEGIYVSTPCKVPLPVPASYIGAGEYFSVAMTRDGGVWTWGHNLYGQLGNGGKKNSRIPVKVYLNGERARLVGAAYEGAFAVTEDNHVWVWGDNEASGLGIQSKYGYGVQQIIRTPTRAPLLEKYADKMVYIAGGNGWGEALLKDGSVIGWGMHASLGQGITRTNISNPNPVYVIDASKDPDKAMTQIHARYVGTTGLTRTNQIYTWGQTGGSAFPMVYGPSPTLRNTQPGKIVEAIGGGKEHIFYQTTDKSVYGIGYNDLYKLDLSKCCAPNINWPGKEIRFQP